MPPRSTKAPKFTTEDTTPLRTSPGFRLTRNSPRCSRWVSSSQARRESTTLLRFLSSSMIFASSDLPMYGWRSRTRRSSTRDAGRKPTQTDVDDEPALHDLDDEALDDATGLLDPLDGAPGALVLGTLLGEDEATLLVLLLEHERFDLFADRDDVVRIEVMADRELAGRDHALGLEADVEKHLILVDLHDLAGDDVSILEGDDGLVDRVLEGQVAEIVLDDLAGDVNPVGVEGSMTFLVCGEICGGGAHRVGHWK